MGSVALGFRDVAAASHAPKAQAWELQGHTFWIVKEMSRAIGPIKARPLNPKALRDSDFGPRQADHVLGCRSRGGMRSSRRLDIAGRPPWSEGVGRAELTTSSSEVPRNIRALILRIGFWGPLYYNYNSEPHLLAIIWPPFWHSASNSRAPTPALC